MSDNKHKAGSDMFVAFSYKVYNDQTGELLFATPTGAPDVMVYGATPEIIPGLLGALEGLGKGDRYEVTLPPEAAFGQRSDDMVMTFGREVFERDGKLADEVQVDAELPMMTADGHRVIGRVTHIGDKEVVMDFNHPFAGLTVRMEGTVDEVRPATPDEIAQAKSPGCHGGCGGCGGCGGGCGDGKDCDSDKEGGCCGNGGCC